MIATVVFDLDGVVCRFDPARRLSRLVEATGLTADHIDAAIWGSGLEARAELGQLSRAATYDAVLACLERRIDADALRSIWSNAFIPDPAVVDLVGRCNIPTMLMTNNGPILDDCLATELAPLARPFTGVFMSWRLRARKPSPEAFASVANALAIAPDALVLIDDDLRNVEAALLAGWCAVRYEHPTQLRSTLTEFGVLSS